MNFRPLSRVALIALIVFGGSLFALACAAFQIWFGGIGS
jgi:hypothetical protein